MLADEDKPKLVPVCLRYINDGAITESAAGFVETADMIAEGISQRIHKVLKPLDLDPALCVGSCFDGASDTSGNRGGVHVD